MRLLCHIFSSDYIHNFACVLLLQAERWKAVTPEQRAPLVALADADRARYEREMAVYKAGTDASVSSSE